MDARGIEEVIRLEVSDITCNPVAAGLRPEEVPSNEIEEAAMQNLVFQAILEKRRLGGGYRAWRD